MSETTVDYCTARSLFLTSKLEDVELAYATGFVVMDGKGSPCLITNWHVLSGRDPSTLAPMDSKGRVPNRLDVGHHWSQESGKWIIHEELLRDKSGSPRWRQHPLGPKIDVALLPLTSLYQVNLHTLDLSLADADVIVDVGMPAMIVGFPHGVPADGLLPFWKTGHIATDPDLDVDGQPKFFIDATTRAGMSGSPVYLRLYGAVRRSSAISLTHMATRLLGIYSAQSEASELGLVWKVRAIRELLADPTAPDVS